MALAASSVSSGIQKALVSSTSKGPESAQGSVLELPNVPVSSFLLKEVYKMALPHWKLSRVLEWTTSYMLLLSTLLQYAVLQGAETHVFGKSGCRLIWHRLVLNWISRQRRQPWSPYPHLPCRLRSYGCDISPDSEPEHCSRCPFHE